jgi:nucleotide-binding universal stress UspA family protein
MHSAGGFHTVLVAYDGSPGAEDALRVGERLWAPGDGGLILACVAPAAPAWSTEESAREEHDATRAMLEEGRSHVDRGVRVRLVSRSAESSARGLTELAESEGADLIVVGPSAHSRDGGVATGRTANRLLQGAPCAVAVTPAGFDAERFQHVGVAYDASPEADAALAAGYAIAARDGAAITLVSALPAASAECEELDEQLAMAVAAAPEGVDSRTTVVYGDPAAAIRQACDGIVDLMMAGSRGYGPVRRALTGSISAGLVERAPHPVVVMPRPGARAPSSALSGTGRARTGT